MRARDDCPELPLEPPDDYWLDEDELQRLAEQEEAAWIAHCESISDMKREEGR